MWWRESGYEKETEEEMEEADVWKLVTVVYV